MGLDLLAALDGMHSLGLLHRGVCVCVTEKESVCECVRVCVCAREKVTGEVPSASFFLRSYSSA